MNQEKQEQKELKEDEAYCEQCKKIVPKSEINPYFGICFTCINNCGTGH